MSVQQVLVIESDARTSSAVADGLRALGAAVRVVEDGEQGLALAEAEPPALVVLAVELPGMSGYSVCKSLRRGPRTGSVPVFLMSTTATEEIFAQHKRLPTRATEYFTKPLDVAAVVAAARPLLAPAPVAADDDALAGLIEDEIALALEGDLFGGDDAAAVEAPRSSLATPNAGSGVVALAASMRAKDGATVEAPAVPAGHDEPGAVAVSGATSAEAARQLMAAEAARAEAESRLAASQAASAQAETARAAAQRDAEVLRAQVAQLEANVASALDAARRAEQRLADVEGARRVADSTSTASARELLAIRELLNGKEREVLELKDEIFRRDHQIIEADERRDTAARKIEELQAQLRKETEQAAALVADLDITRAKLGDAETLLAETRTTHAAEIETARGAHAAAEAAAAARETELRGELEGLYARLEEALETVAATARERDAQNEARAAAEADAATLRDEVALLRASLEAEGQALHDARQTIATHEASIAALDEARQGLEATLQATAQTLGEATERGDSLAATLDTTTATLADTREGLRSAEARIAALDDALGSERAAHAAAVAAGVAALQAAQTDAAQRLGEVRAVADASAEHAAQVRAALETRVAELTAAAEALDADRKRVAAGWEAREEQLIGTCDELSIQMLEVRAAYDAKLVAADRTIEALGEDVRTLATHMKALRAEAEARGAQLAAVAAAIGAAAQAASLPDAPEPTAHPFLAAYAQASVPELTLAPVPERSVPSLASVVIPTSPLVVAPAPASLDAGPPMPVVAPHAAAGFAVPAANAVDLDDPTLERGRGAAAMAAEAEVEPPGDTGDAPGHAADERADANDGDGVGIDEDVSVEPGPAADDDHGAASEFDDGGATHAEHATFPLDATFAAAAAPADGDGADVSDQGAVSGGHVGVDAFPDATVGDDPGAIDDEASDVGAPAGGEVAAEPDAMDASRFGDDVGDSRRSDAAGSSSGLHPFFTSSLPPGVTGANPTVAVEAVAASVDADVIDEPPAGAREAEGTDAFADDKGGVADDASAPDDDEADDAFDHGDEREASADPSASGIDPLDALLADLGSGESPASTSASSSSPGPRAPYERSPSESGFFDEDGEPKASKLPPLRAGDEPELVPIDGDALLGHDADMVDLDADSIDVDADLIDEDDFI